MTNNYENVKNEIEINVDEEEPKISNDNHNENCFYKCFQYLFYVLNTIISCFRSIFDNIFDDQPKPGGLYNSKSSCYMNAMIQALSSSDILIETLGNLTKSHSNSNLLLLYDLLNGLNESTTNNENVKKNTDLLRELMKSVGWTKPAQQDAYHLLSVLINSLHEKLNDKDEIEIPLRIKLIHEFQETGLSNNVQHYLGLSINLCGNYKDRPGVPLSYLINQHFLSTAIDGDKSKLTRLSVYREAPKILLIHIQANILDPTSSHTIKPIYYIQFDETMTLSFDIVNEINEKKRDLREKRILGTQVEYCLKSVVLHRGNIFRGHYVTYKKWQNEWYLANDKSIKKVPLNKEISPYIMIYDRL